MCDIQSKNRWNEKKKSNSSNNKIISFLVSQVSMRKPYHIRYSYTHVTPIWTRTLLTHIWYCSRVSRETARQQLKLMDTSRQMVLYCMRNTTHTHSLTSLSIVLVVLRTRKCCHWNSHETNRIRRERASEGEEQSRAEHCGKQQQQQRW